MQRAGDFHHHIFKIDASISEYIFDNATSLDTSNHMLNNDP
jgi:hypothetical protein